MIRSLQDNFKDSMTATDENSKAYCTMLKGEAPPTSSNMETHIALRLLTLRFLDIVQSLDKRLRLMANLKMWSGRTSLYIRSMYVFISLYFRNVTDVD